MVISIIDRFIIIINSIQYRLIYRIVYSRNNDAKEICVSSFDRKKVMTLTFQYPAL